MGVESVVHLQELVATVKSHCSLNPASLVFLRFSVVFDFRLVVIIDTDPLKHQSRRLLSRVILVNKHLIGVHVCDLGLNTRVITYSKLSFGRQSVAARLICCADGIGRRGLVLE